MSRENSLKNKMANRVADFLDDRFDEYRGQISIDISKGLSKLAGVIAIWTMIILFLVFSGLAIALGLGALTGSYIAGFAIVAVIHILIMYLVMKNLGKWIEEPIFNISKKALRGSITTSETDEKLLEEVVRKIEKERQNT
ncbi:MAG: hypothetical protein AAF502_14930 [Bacteroidota bacterium]